MIVVDTNVIAYFWLPGDFTPAAEEALKYDANWVIPYLWRSEFRNVLVTCVRAKRLKAGDAQAVYINAETMLRGREYAVTGGATLDLAFKSNLSAYDCEYVALAEDLDCKLITADKKIVKAFPKRARLLSDFGA